MPEVQKEIIDRKDYNVTGFGIAGIKKPLCKAAKKNTGCQEYCITNFGSVQNNEKVKKIILPVHSKRFC